MNIFVTSSDPVACAKYLDDKRVNKMLLESVQLLSTTMHLTGLPGPYKPTHRNHPCTLWLLQSKANYQWLYNHAIALYNEYLARSGKYAHGCYQPLLACQYGDLSLPSIGLTNFVNCTTYKDVDDVHLAYQLVLNDKWDNDKRTPTWYGEER
jgi:hypothetical protein